MTDGVPVTNKELIELLRYEAKDLRGRDWSASPAAGAVADRTAEYFEAAASALEAAEARIAELEREQRMLCGRCGHSVDDHDEETPNGWCESCEPDSGATPDPDHRFVDSVARIALADKLAKVVEPDLDADAPVVASLPYALDIESVVARGRQRRAEIAAALAANRASEEKGG